MWIIDDLYWTCVDKPNVVCECRTKRIPIRDWTVIWGHIAADQSRTRQDEQRCKQNVWDAPQFLQGMRVWVMTRQLENKWYSLEYHIFVQANSCTQVKLEPKPVVTSWSHADKWFYVSFHLAGIFHCVFSYNPRMVYLLLRIAHGVN